MKHSAHFWNFFRHNSAMGLVLLGVCSALAVTNNLKHALIISLVLTVVTMITCSFVSLIRNFLPSRRPRLIYLLLAVTGVIVCDQFLKAYYLSYAREVPVFTGL